MQRWIIENHLAGSVKSKDVAFRLKFYFDFDFAPFARPLNGRSVMMEIRGADSVINCALSYKLSRNAHYAPLKHVSLMVLRSRQPVCTDLNRVGLLLSFSSPGRGESAIECPSSFRGARYLIHVASSTAGPAVREDTCLCHSSSSFHL